MNYWNRHKEEAWKLGDTGIPTRLKHPERMMGGATLLNPIEDWEKISQGSPFEYDYKAHTAKVLKCWKIVSATVDGTNTIVELHNTFLTPALKEHMFIMVMPSTITGKGKAVECPVVQMNEAGNYLITLVTANVDALAKDGFIVESSATAAGTGKDIYCKPTKLTMEDILGGDYNQLGVPRGFDWVYENCCPAMPQVVKDNLVNIEWEWYNEIP